MNIVLIVIDALRFDHLGCNSYKFNTSENIDKLAKRGVSYQDAYCCINATEPSLTSIFSGLLPKTHKMINHGPKVTRKNIRALEKKNIPWLPQILKNKGYKTVGIDWLGRWHKRGFDRYGISKSKIIRPIEDAAVITNQAIRAVGGLKKDKFFLFMHYWDTHTPYAPPRGYAKNFIEEKDTTISIKQMISKIGNPKWKEYYKKCAKGLKNTAQMEAQYDAEIFHVDLNIGRLIGELPEDTLVIITGDHGESMTEHGIYFTHHGLYDCTIHVPLIITHLGVKSHPNNIYGPVQHTDIVPTILDVLDIKTRRKFDGKSLVCDKSELELRNYIYVEEAHAQRKEAYRIREAKLIKAKSKKGARCEWCQVIHGGGMLELYDMLNDPGENRNILL